jgi:hypothetical protein
MNADLAFPILTFISLSTPPKIMKIFWPNKISNKDLHNITNTKDMEILLIQKRLRWLGHVLRKPSEDMTKVALRWTSEGKRKRGRPKTTIFYNCK